MKITRSENIFDPVKLDQKIMDHKHDPQFYDLIFGLTTVKKSDLCDLRMNKCMIKYHYIRECNKYDLEKGTILR